MSTAPHRNDIDGLRALAVLAVIFFHFGTFPHGYLGVDVFFVISGFLITGIVRREMQEGRFSLRAFYLRRTRRIIPLSLFFGALTLGLGAATLLPDDLENLAQSVIATNFFGNNVLQALTTKNYWDVVNEYKPLMHTWSLGVEEQFYLLHPFLLLLVGRKRPGAMLPTLAGLALVSLALRLWPGVEEHRAFYFIHFRFWELAVGGVAALAWPDRKLPPALAPVVVLGLVALLALGLPGAPPEAALVATVILTAMLLRGANQESRIAARLLGNRPLVAIGRISFSLYMWHQVLLAFARYAWIGELNAGHLALLLALMLGLSTATYFWIEQPCRDRKRVSTPVLLAGLAAVFLATTGFSYHIYRKAGVLRDVPELGITRAQAQRNMHAVYNARIREKDRGFAADTRTRVLVIGNSFARDWANVLLESSFAAGLDLSYVEFPKTTPDLAARAREADVIFITPAWPGDVAKLSLPPEKVWGVGLKNFGVSNGIFYNRRGPDYFAQRTRMVEADAGKNANMRQAWGARFLDYVPKVMDAEGRVPVFTPEGKFISQDCRHLTQAGARYFAELFQPELKTLLGPRVTAPL